MSSVHALASPLGSASSPGWHDRLSLLLESTGEGIFGVDIAGRCSFANRAAAEMLGYASAEMLGRNMHGLIHHTHSDGRHYPEADCPIFNAFRQGLPCRIDDEVLWRADGTSFLAEYSSHPVIENGQVLGAVMTFKDITARREAEALAQLRALAAHLDAVRENERLRIAREIHDELGALLVALKLDVGWLGKRVAEQPDLHGKCKAMGQMIDTAVGNVGRIITDLRPSILDHQGLWAALEWQAQEFIESAAELQVDLRAHVAHGVPAAQGAADGGWSIAVFRIFQEMLSNVALHAKATRVEIRIMVDAPPAPLLYIEVRDDGVGAEPAALNAPRSYGVLGMRERAAHFGGTLRIDGAPGAGTRARLVMPLPETLS